MYMLMEQRHDRRTSLHGSKARHPSGSKGRQDASKNRQNHVFPEQDSDQSTPALFRRGQKKPQKGDHLKKRHSITAPLPAAMLPPPALKNGLAASSQALSSSISVSRGLSNNVPVRRHESLAAMHYSRSNTERLLPEDFNRAHLYSPVSEPYTSCPSSPIVQRREPIHEPQYTPPPRHITYQESFRKDTNRSGHRVELLRSKSRSRSSLDAPFLPASVSTPPAVRKRLGPPLSTDVSIILGIFDPVRNDLRRAEIEREARIVSNDRIGFDFVQQELRTLSLLKALCIGSRRNQRLTQVGDLPAIEQIYSALILKKYRSQLQRPKKKPLHEYYNDDDAELEGKAKVMQSNPSRASN